MVEPTHLKHISQIGLSFQVRVKIKNIWNHQPVSYRWWFRKSGVHQLKLAVYPVIYQVLYMPGGCLGFLNHQQYWHFNTLLLCNLFFPFLTWHSRKIVMITCHHFKSFTRSVFFVLPSIRRFWWRPRPIFLQHFHHHVNQKAQQTSAAVLRPRPSNPAVLIWDTGLAGRSHAFPRPSESFSLSWGFLSSGTRSNPTTNLSILNTIINNPSNPTKDRYQTLTHTCTHIMAHISGQIIQRYFTMMNFPEIRGPISPQLLWGLRSVRDVAMKFDQMYPIASMYGIFTYTCTIKINQNIGLYIYR